LNVGYLIDAIAEGGGAIKLRFYDPSTSSIREFRDDTYKPYFFLPFPMTEHDEQVVHNLHGEVEITSKTDLYSNETRQVAKVKLYKPELLRKATKQFETAWESEIEYVHSYAYDHKLVFGTQHTQLLEDDFAPVSDMAPELKGEFDKVFGQVKDSDRLKYSQLEHWFSLLHHPVPEVIPDLLNAHGKIDSDKYYSAFMLSRIVNLPVSYTYASRSVSDWLKSMMYSYLRRHDILIPTSKELRRGFETHMVPGALTITPKSGIYFNTVVTDFESLYPSCIDSYNLSYETVDCQHEECKQNMIAEVGHYVCMKRRGFLAALVGALKDLRIHWFKPLSKNTSITKNERYNADIIARLLKLLTVSSYGVSVRIHGLACPPLAESITGYGRWVLQTTWDLAERNGLHPVYGDTDSIFLENASTNTVEWLIRTVKETLQLDLAVERRYSVCVLSRAKKAYFGILTDGTPDLKGLTAIKSNAPNFIQRVFKNCVQELSKVSTKQEYDLAKIRMAEIVEKAIRELRDRKVRLEDLIYTVNLFHDPREKLQARVLPQPYQCAAQLINSGKQVKQGDNVSFVKVRPFTYRNRQFTVKPMFKVQSVQEINVEDYIRNLTTALNQTFEPMGITFEVKDEPKITEWLGKGG
jgi:DNA polymerase elongation subunit (family B)